MDSNTWRNRLRKRELLVLPDADVSEPDTDSDSEEGSDGSSASEEDDNDEDIPAELPTKKPSGIIGDWEQNKDLPHVRSAFLGSFAPPPADTLEAIDYFNLIFTTEMKENIVEQTNIYAEQSGSSFRIDAHKLEVYLGTLLSMTIIHLPSYRDYFAQHTRIPFIADYLSRNDLLSINKFLHFNDNNDCVTDRDSPNYDRLFKIRPLLSSFRKRCLEISNEEFQSIDEQMIPFKGRSHLKQYMPKKPKKWGFKVFARCGVSGLIYDFYLYEGKSPELADPETSCGNQLGNIFIRLSESCPRDLNIKMHFDNYFTNINMMVQLKVWGIYSTGTVRADRLLGASNHLTPVKELERNGRGSCSYAFTPSKNTVICRWKDNGVVHCASNYVGVNPISSVKRYDKKEKMAKSFQCPGLIKAYNSYMGGVDTHDMLQALYRLDYKSRKWYKRIFNWVIQAAITNAWILYKRDCVQENVKGSDVLALKSFSIEVIHALHCSANKTMKRGRPTKDVNDEGPAPAAMKRSNSRDPIVAMRYDSIGHWPNLTDTKLRCRLCKNTTQMRCLKCGVNLCITRERNCFQNYHI